MEGLTVRAARRLALVKAGLLPAGARAPRGRARARDAAVGVVRRFGYLQLDTVSVAGARSHAIVLLSRLAGLPSETGEELLQPGTPLFEYWGHEVSWMPIELYPTFAFRRRRFRRHPWWGDVIGAHKKLAGEILGRIRDEGPLRSADLEGEGGAGWWQLKPAKRVIVALWSSGDLAVRERKGFQRTFDLTERVIPEEWRSRELPEDEAVRVLVEKALEGHGWAERGTLARTWRFTRMTSHVDKALRELEAAGRVVRCTVAGAKGWIRPEDLGLAGSLERLRPREDQGVLLSPFDPILWERKRVAQLFGFEQVLEIFVPAARRRYGYYCLPVLAGEKLVARFDLKADRKAGKLRVLARHYEARPVPAAWREATRGALERFAGALGLEVSGRT